MGLLKRKIGFFLLLGGVLTLFTQCTVSYKLSGASNIDYTKIKTIVIKDFPNRAPLVFPPLSQMFTEMLKDRFIRQTKLSLENNNGDLELEGEITGYDLTPMAVKEDAYASRTKLTISVRVRYRNKVNSDQYLDQTFSAFSDFDSSSNLQSVQEELCTQICKDIINEIFNATVANW